MAVEAKERVGRRIQTLRQICADFENEQFDIPPNHLIEARRLFAAIKRNIGELRDNMHALMRLVRDR
jgi:hypothetical protein